MVSTESSLLEERKSSFEVFWLGFACASGIDDQGSNKCFAAWGLFASDCFLEGGFRVIVETGSVAVLSPLLLLFLLHFCEDGRLISEE